MYTTLARINTQQIELKTEVDSIVQKAIASIHSTSPAAWVLNLDKQGYALETITKIYLPDIATDAIYGLSTGREVGSDTGYGKPRYLEAESVSAIAQTLRTLPKHPLPKADSTGYTPDPRLAANAQLQAVSKHLTLIGIDFRDPEEIETIEDVLTATIDFYQQAQQHKQGMLLFTR